MPANPQPLILDCDTANEVDDQFAIAYALGCPALAVRGVISVHNTIADGPGSRDRYQAEAERVVDLCGADVPCIRGAERPMDAPSAPVASAGLDFLIAQARDTPLTVLATGPLTDVASLCLAAPDVAANVRVIWLGGFPDASYYRCYQQQELNGRADITAWRVLWQSGVELLHVPGWPGPMKLAVSGPAYAARLRAQRRPIADYLASILLAWTQTEASDGRANGHKSLWDIATVAVLACPQATTVAARAAPYIDGAGAHDWQRPGRVLATLIDLEPTAVFADFETALRRHPTAPMR